MLIAGKRGTEHGSVGVCPARALPGSQRWKQEKTGQMANNIHGAWYLS
jgi:hypothetical protein